MHVKLPAFREIVANLLFVVLFYNASDLNEACGLLGDFTDHSLLDDSWKNNCHDSNLDSPPKNSTRLFEEIASSSANVLCSAQMMLVSCPSECDGVGGHS